MSLPLREIQRKLTERNTLFLSLLSVIGVELAALTCMFPVNLLYNQSDCESQRVVVSQSVVFVKDGSHTPALETSS